MPPKRDLITLLSMAVGVPFLYASAWPAVALGLLLLAFGVYTGVDSAYRTVGRYVTV